MIDEKKRKRYIIGIVLIGILFVGTIVFATLNYSKKTTATEPVKTSKSTVKKSSSVEQSSEETKSSSSESSSKQSDTEKLNEFLKIYKTQELKDSSIEDRSVALKNLMTEKAYKDNGIADTVTVLKSLLKTFNETKEINTSNSTALVEQKYVRSSVYQDSSIKSQYYVEVYYTERLIYQKEPYGMVQKMNISMSNGKVAQITVLDTRTQEGAK